MKNFLRKILLLFVIVLLNQSYVENTCWGMDTTNVEAISKLSKKDIWDIIVEIANGKVQPKLDYDMKNILEKYDTKVGKITFAEFVKKLSGDELFKLVTLGIEMLKNPIISIKNDSELKHIKKALNNICQKNSGRLLLIRLLIAVMKSDVIQDKTSYKLTIENKNGEFCHADDPRHITLDLLILAKLRYTLFSEVKQDNSILMTSEQDESLENVDVALFHEMVHVFHGINNFKKNKGYKSGCSYSPSSKGYNVSNVINNPLFKYYYEDFLRTRQIIDDIKNWKTQMMPWHVKDSRKDEFYVNFEEMLTIAGLPIEKDAYKSEYKGGYEPGDELSENLYRAEKGLPLRFSHKMFTYYESEKVYAKVKECVTTNLNYLGSEYNEKFSGREIEQYEECGKIAGLDKHEGFNGMYYYTINPSFSKFAVEEKFKYPLNALINDGKEMIYYYLRSEYNEFVFNRFKFD